MKIEKILSEINDCINNADLLNFDKNLDLLLIKLSDEDACKQLAQILGNNYSQFKSDYLAKILEIIIRKRSNLASVNHPFNILFQMTISTGSFEMYECYIEEYSVPYLSKIPLEEHELHYMELLNTAQELSEKLFKENKKCIKGMHYNGVSSRYENNENFMLINEQDYTIMEDVLERYNTIVGRGLIIEDLNKRSGLN